MVLMLGLYFYQPTRANSLFSDKPSFSLVNLNIKPKQTNVVAQGWKIDSISKISSLPVGSLATLTVLGKVSDLVKLCPRRIFPLLDDRFAPFERHS